MHVRLEQVLPFRSPSASTRAHLLCLPFAGGGALTFREWTGRLPAHIDVCAYELPGHGTRRAERLCDEPEPVIAELASVVAQLDDAPIVVFGHSLGARLGFALAQSESRVALLLASAMRAPHLPAATQGVAELPRAPLVARIEAMGGTPRAILDDPDVLDLFLPTLKADFWLVDRLAADKTAAIAAPITVFYGVEDPAVSREQALAWELHTTGRFRSVEMAGGHFFVTTHRDRVLAEVNRALETDLAV